MCKLWLPLIREDRRGREGGGGHLFSVMLRVRVQLNSTGDSDEASSCWELLLGAWARLEVGVGLQ